MTAVLDASAILAFLHDDPGALVIAQAEADLVLLDHGGEGGDPPAAHRIGRARQ